MSERGPQADRDDTPQETHDPEMTDADEGNDPPEEDDDRDDDRPVARPL